MVLMFERCYNADEFRYYLVYANYGDLENTIFNPLPGMIGLILLFYYINKKKLDID